MLRSPNPVLFTVLCVVFCFLRVQAQPGNSNQWRNLVTSGTDIRNARMMDSLYSLRSSSPGMSRFTTWEKLPAGTPGRPEKVPFRLSGAVSRARQQTARSGMETRQGSTVCYTVSGRNFLRQDSLRMWPGDPALTSDGNVIVPGQWSDYIPNTYSYPSGGFCMKTDLEGNVIWAWLYDSTAHLGGDFINYFEALELRDHTILLAGRTRNSSSGNNDVIITRLDNTGRLIWSKTYQSRYWQGYNGSGDFFTLQSLKEDPATGSVYFTGSHWAGITTITKLDPADGRIVWSTGYPSGTLDRTFGLVVNADNLLLFQLGLTSYNDDYIDVLAVNKTNGDTLYSRHLVQTGDRNAPRLYGTFEVVKLNNGHFVMSGPTTGNFEYPVYTGKVDLYRAGVIELDANLKFIRAYGFRSRANSNIDNTRISFFPDGTGIFTMLDVLSGYNADSYITVFKDRLMYHQRRRIHINEGMPYEPHILQLPDGGFLNIKLMGDSTKDDVSKGKETRIDYYRMHAADTLSLCLGVKDSAVYFWDFNFVPAPRYYDSIRRNVFTESRLKTLRSQGFGARPEPACQTISHCDVLAMNVSAATVCPGSDITLTIHKNKECGSLVPLVYDTNWVGQVTRITDSSYALRFNGTGKGYIRASLMGCTLKQDSVLVEVLPARNSLSLGKDTAICPGNTLLLNAGRGFASYSWQDGSTDSTYLVKAPGRYLVNAVNGCGGTYRDTVDVAARPPVSINIGPDRTKCNQDTLQLSAPAGFINYRWSNNYQLSSVNSQTVVADPLVDTAYYLKAEKTPGCFAFDTISIRVYHSPAIDLGKDKSFCRGDSALFDAGPGFQSYRWNNGLQEQRIIAGAAGSYSVTGITAQGCKSYDTATVISVHPLPVVALDKGNALCSGDSKLLSAGSFAAYQWSTGATSQSIQVNSTGQYSVTVTDANGCKASDTTAIATIYPLPAAFLPQDTAVCSYGTLKLQPATGFTRYQWNTGASSSGITISQPGVYWVQVIDDHACKGADTIRVDQKQCMSGFYIPTAFSPNNDGRNDDFKPLLFGNVKQYRFTIYDRWGTVVYQTTDLRKGWDGKRQGSFLLAGVFVWTCTYQFEGEKQKLEKGTVVLVR